MMESMAAMSMLSLSIAFLFLRGNMRLLELDGLSEPVELRDHIDWALLRSNVDGAEEESTESKASKPTRNFPS